MREISFVTSFCVLDAVTAPHLPYPIKTPSPYPITETIKSLSSKLAEKQVSPLHPAIIIVVIQKMDKKG